MLHVVTAGEMRAMDAHTIKELMVPSAVLMERAALGLAREVLLAAGAKKDPRILIVCGSGNNGGDGAALARILFIKGLRPKLYVLGNPERFSPDMAAQMASIRRLGVAKLEDPDMGDYDIIVDAMFGTGLCRDLEGRYREAVEAINASGAFVIAADMPSGIHADTGQVLGAAVRANRTVTMECAKVGQLLYPGAAYTGRLLVEEIGIYDDPSLLNRQPFAAYSLEKDDLPALLPARAPDGNKGTFGKVLVIAGSKGMCGAALFAAEAALRTGCGMVKVLTDEANREIVQTCLPEALFASYRDADEAEGLLEAALAWPDVTVIGPGLGQSEAKGRLVRSVMRRAGQPLVIDADGLNLLAGMLKRDPALLRECKAPVFLTPHMGEMARLSGRDINSLKEDPISEALRFSKEHGVYLLLKDARTVVASPEGPIFINVSGNSGMATAGSGDVLAGVLGSLLAQGADVLSAGALAAFLHGLAGEAAAGEKGEAGMTARDIIACLPGVLSPCIRRQSVL